MAKASGNTKIVKPYPLSYGTLNALYHDRLNVGMPNMTNSFISEALNAFYIEDSRRIPDENEKLAAMHLVGASISVEMTPEGIIAYATAFKPDGTAKYSDGKAALYTFEQKTVEKDATNMVVNYRNGIKHAVEKGADIALIFDRYGLGHREQVETAMREYKLPRWGKLPKAVIVISREGGVYEHHF